MRNINVMRKSWVVGMLALAAGLGLMGNAEAATSDTVSLKVTVAVSLSVDIGTTTYDFGSALSANQTAISTGAIPVLNDSSGLTEDLQINGSNTADWTAHATTNTTTNNFNLRCLVSSHGATSPNYANFDFGGTNGLTNSAPQNLSAANFAFGAQGNGNDVASGTYKSLWFRMITPASISAGNNVQQSVTVTVTAAASSTY